MCYGVKIWARPKGLRSDLDERNMSIYQNIKVKQSILFSSYLI